MALVHEDDLDDEDLTVDDESAEAAATLRSLADEKLAEAERIRTTSRATFAWVATMFTIAQAVALSSFHPEGVNNTEQTVIIAFGIAAAAFLVGTGIAVVKLDHLESIPNPNAKTIRRELAKARAQQVPFSVRMMAVWAKVVRKREAANDAREEAREGIYHGCTATVLLVGLEIIVALVARIP